MYWAEPSLTWRAFTLVNILVVSDIRIYREGLRELLARNGQINVAGTASTSNDAIDLLVKSPIDVILVDVGSETALALTKAVGTHFSRIKVVAFGLTDCKKDILEYAEAGISGYVSKEACASDLVSAVVHASQGELHCSPEIAGALMERLSRLAKQNSSISVNSDLTPRELQIAELVSEGLSNSEIASCLKIRLATTKTHVHHILDKLGVRRRGQVNSRLNKRLSGRTNL
jgi:DNA-binding NarL/FixJ family response regulator